MERKEKGIGKICPGGIYHPMGEMEKLHRPVDNSKAQGDEGIDAAGDDAVE